MVITMGDPCGIGPEIIAKTWLEHPHLVRDCVVVGDAGVMVRALRLVSDVLGRDPDVLKVVSWPTGQLAPGGLEGAAPSGSPGTVSVFQPLDPLPALPDGKVHPVSGAAAAHWVSWAADQCLNGRFSAMVTAPLNKEALSAAGPPWSAYPGHTELLQARSARFLGCDTEAMPVRMMLSNAELSVVLVTIHMALREALDAITLPRVMQTLEITHVAFQRMLGRPPKMALAGVNPHAGEAGRFGREEIDVLEPAARRATERGWHVVGPIAPDTVFMRARQGEFDVVIAMYHDQGLIPVKYMGLDAGVNTTLGLPLVRTSPDHGTAYDIAWQGRADARSFTAALKQAKQCLAGR
jgi:4-hydroxythreonine-4-phosphate dehydrogenase